MTEFSELLGKTLTAVTESRYEIIFKCDDGSSYRQFHAQDCCENVEVEEVIGDFADLIGVPILESEETSERGGGGTWTFYKLGTIRGFVTIRWLGVSSGYYSESADFQRIA